MDELVDKGIEEVKARIPKYFKIGDEIRKSRLGKFLEGTGRSTAYAMIPLTIILVGLLFNLYGLQTTVSVDNTTDFQNSVLSSSRPIAFSTAELMDNVFIEHGNELVALRNNLNNNFTSARIPGFEPNATFTPRPEFNELINKTIDKSVTSFAKWEDRSPSNSTVAYAESITLFLQDAYRKTPKSLFIRAVYVDGLVQTYPYIQSNISVFNPVKEPWYNGTFKLNPLGYFLSNPYYDETTGRMVVSISVQMLREGAFLGALQMVLDLGLIRAELAAFETPSNRLTMISNDSKVIYDESLDLSIYGMNETTFNHTISELDNSTEAETIANFLNSVVNVSRYSLFELNNTKFAIWGFKINSTGYTLSYLVELPKKPVLSTFDETEMFLIPGLATFIGLFALLFLQLQFGFLEDKDIETLIRDLLEKSRIDNLSARLMSRVNKLTSGELLEDVANAATERIQKRGEEFREKISGTIEGKISDISEKIDEKLEELEKQEEAEPVTEIFEKNKIMARVMDAFAKNPILYLQNKFAAKGINLEQIKKGDFSSLKNLATEPERLLATLTAGGEIPLKDLADLVNIDASKLENFFGSLPLYAGIGIDDEKGTIIVNRAEFISNLDKTSSLFKEFFQNPEEYLKNIPGDNFQKIAKNAEKVKIIAKLLAEGDEVPIQQVANVLGLPKDETENLLKVASKKSSVKLKMKKGKIKVNNKDQFMEKLPDFSAKIIEKLVTEAI